MDWFSERTGFHLLYEGKEVFGIAAPFYWWLLVIAVILVMMAATWRRAN